VHASQGVHVQDIHMYAMRICNAMHGPSCRARSRRLSSSVRVTACLAFLVVWLRCALGFWYLPAVHARQFLFLNLVFGIMCVATFVTARASRVASHCTSRMIQRCIKLHNPVILDTIPMIFNSSELCLLDIWSHLASFRAFTWHKLIAEEIKHTRISSLSFMPR
jgi:hypothetical protein